MNSYVSRDLCIWWHDSFPCVTWRVVREWNQHLRTPYEWAMWRPMWVSHVPCEWVMSRRNMACPTWMSHANQRPYGCVVSHMNESFTVVTWNETSYGVALVSWIDSIIVLFRKRALEKRRYSWKKTYNLIDPTDRSHPVFAPCISMHHAAYEWIIRITHINASCPIWMHESKCGVNMCGVTHAFI